MKNSDGDAQANRQKVSTQQSKADALEEELIAARKQHTELARLQGTYKAEFEVG